MIEYRARTVQYVPSEDKISNVVTNGLVKVPHEEHTAGMEKKEDGTKDEEKCLVSDLTHEE